MAESPFQPQKTLGEILDEYILAERHPRLEDLAKGNFPEGDYWVGYRYLDLTAGPTVNVETFCDIDDAGQLIKRRAPHDEGSRWMIRSSVMDDWPVAVLTEAQRQSLGLPEKPDWASHYESQDESPEALLQKGTILNSGGMCHEAIPILQRALQELPDSPRAAFELLFAFNATQQSVKAIELINDLPKDGAWTKSGMVFREIAFAIHETGDPESAIGLYAHAFELLPPEDKGNRAEVAFNAGSICLQQNDQEQASHWWNIAWQLSPENSAIHNHLKQFVQGD